MEMSDKYLASLVPKSFLCGEWRDKVDPIEEYKLIMQKKSNLSKSQRDQIVWEVERLRKGILIIDGSEK